MQDKEKEVEASTDVTDGGMIITLTQDVFFGMRIRTITRKLGYETVLTKNETEAVDESERLFPVLALIDFNKGVDWTAMQPLLASSVPVIGFGSHTDVEGFRAAKTAGVDRVVSNGQLSRSLPELIVQYKITSKAD